MIGVGNEGAVQVGKVKAVTTSGKGLSVDHWTERCLAKIVWVAEDSESIIAEQARAFRDQVRDALKYHMQAAVKSDRTTLYNVLIKAGHREAAEIIRRL